MITLVQDGPNENKTIFQHMNELILQDHPEFPGLIDLGSCTIHIIHNAFGKGIDQYGKGIDQLCMDLYFLFKFSTARCEDFKNIQIEMEVESHNFQQHTEVWWLSIEPSIKRILEQWDAVIQFVAELCEDPRKVPKSISYKRVYINAWTQREISHQVSLEFLNHIIPVFEKFLLLASLPEKLSSGRYPLW